jgi:hypothetical protein
MSYTVSWEQLAFSDFTWSNVLKLVPTVVNCKFIPKPWNFTLTEGQDTVYIERYPPKYVFSNTSEIPFTKNLMKTLIIMVEFGAAKALKHDNNYMSMFLTVLDEVYAVYPLVSYEEQRKYFLTF